MAFPTNTPADTTAHREATVPSPVSHSSEVHQISDKTETSNLNPVERVGKALWGGLADLGQTESRMVQSLKEQFSQSASLALPHLGINWHTPSSSDASTTVSANLKPEGTFAQYAMRSQYQEQQFFVPRSYGSHHYSDDFSRLLPDRADTQTHYRSTKEIENSILANKAFDQVQPSQPAWLRLQGAQSQYATAATLAIAVGDTSPDLRRAAANNHNISLADLRGLTKDSDPNVSIDARKALAARNDASRLELFDLAKPDQPVEVRAIVAANSNATAMQLAIIIADKSPEAAKIRQIAANNHNLLIGDLQTLTQDADDQVSLTAKKALASRTDSNRQDIFDLVKPGQPAEVRALAAANPNASVGALVVAASDKSPESAKVRQAVAGNPNLPLAELRTLIDDKDEQVSADARKALGKRPDVSAQEIEALNQSREYLDRRKDAMKINSDLCELHGWLGRSSKEIESEISKTISSLNQTQLTLLSREYHNQYNGASLSETLMNAPKLSQGTKNICSFFLKDDGGIITESYPGMWNKTWPNQKSRGESVSNYGTLFSDKSDDHGGLISETTMADGNTLTYHIHAGAFEGAQPGEVAITRKDTRNPSHDSTIFFDSKDQRLVVKYDSGQRLEQHLDLVNERTLTTGTGPNTKDNFTATETKEGKQIDYDDGSGFTSGSMNKVKEFHGTALEQAKYYWSVSALGNPVPTTMAQLTDSYLLTDTVKELVRKLNQSK